MAYANPDVLPALSYMPFTPTKVQGEFVVRCSMCGAIMAADSERKIKRTLAHHLKSCPKLHPELYAER